MRARDRLVVAILAAALVAGGVWLSLVSPERAQVATLSAQIATDRTTLTTAEQSLASARSAAASYVGHIHQIDAVMRAIPPSPAEAELITTIVKLAGTNVDFHELDVGGNAATTAGPTALSLSFTFSATYGNLQTFLAAIDSLTSTDGSTLNTNGRLFTINSVALEPSPPSSTTATISAVVYQQSGPMGGAAGATGATGATGAAGAVPAAAVTP
jgi:Tfp pilus assembly protein PilO